MGILACLGVMVASLIYQHYLVSVACLAGGFLVDWAFVGAMRRLLPRQKRAARGATTETSAPAPLASSDDSLLVLQNVPGPQGELGHVMFRSNGAVVVISTHPDQGRVTEFRGDLRINGRPFEKDILREVHRNALWLRDLLRDRYGINGFVTAILVFPNAFVAVRRAIGGVEVATERFLPTLLRRLPANPKTAATVRARLEALQSEAASWHARVP